jgi:hypothetical protein
MRPLQESHRLTGLSRELRRRSALLKKVPAPKEKAKTSDRPKEKFSVRVARKFLGLFKRRAVTA